MVARPDSASIPQGLKTLVWVMSWVDKNEKFNKPQYETAIRIPLEPVKEPVVEFPSWYTPVPYVPPALALVVAFLLLNLAGIYNILSKQTGLEISITTRNSLHPKLKDTIEHEAVRIF